MIQARHPLLAGLAGFMILAGTAAAFGQQSANLICAHRDQILHTLASTYGESVRSIGLAPQNRIVEVFASDETGSWTITVTSADGTTCLMASGRHYETFAPTLPGEPL